MSRIDDLNRILRSLQTESPDIRASALISEDGLMIASALPQHIDEMRVAGMSATLLSLGTRASRELSLGGLEQTLIRGSDGYAVMLTSGKGSMLLAITTKQAKLGLIFLDMSRAAKEIERIL